MINWTKQQIDNAKKDFRVFLFVVWKEIGLPHPTDIQYDMANTLQNVTSDRFILQGFRGVAKSFITCAFCVWTLWRDPQKKVLIVSASKSRSDDNAIFIKKIIFTIDFLAHLRPHKDQRDTQNAFDVGPAKPDASPSVKSVGISGQLTGTRADVLISDDVEVANNSATQMQRDKLNEAVKEYDAILKPGGQIIYLGTPQNEMSIYNELQNRGYQCVIYPVVYPEDRSIRNFYGGRLAKYIADKYDADPDQWAGKPTDPQRFNENEIYKRRMSYGKAGFSLQFLLNTNLSDYEKYPLKVSDLIVESLDVEETSLSWSWSNSKENRLDIECVALHRDGYYAPLSRSKETQKYTMSVMFVDPSGRGKDETAYAVVNFLNGYMFVLDVGGFQDGYSDSTLTQISEIAKRYKVKECLVEPNFGGGMFAQLLKPFMYNVYPACAISDAKTANTQKEARIIDTLEPVLMRHKLILNKQIIEKDLAQWKIDKNYSLIYQMTRLSRDRGSLSHDDRLDALEGAVAYYLEMMSMDEKTGYDELIEEQLEQWLDPDFGVFYKEAPEESIAIAKKINSGLQNYNCMSGMYFRQIGRKLGD